MNRCWRNWLPPKKLKPASSARRPGRAGCRTQQFAEAESAEREEPDVDDESQSTIHPAAEIEARSGFGDGAHRTRGVMCRSFEETAAERSATAADVPPPAPKLPKLSPPIPVTRLPPSLGSESDEDMIVVDDLPRPPAPELPKEPPPKRRHEFRQLFAKLRRE